MINKGLIMNENNVDAKNTDSADNKQMKTFARAVVEYAPSLLTSTHDINSVGLSVKKSNRIFNWVLPGQIPKNASVYIGLCLNKDLENQMYGEDVPSLAKDMQTHAMRLKVDDYNRMLTNARKKSKVENERNATSKLSFETIDNRIYVDVSALLDTPTAGLEFAEECAGIKSRRGIAAILSGGLALGLGWDAYRRLSDESSTTTNKIVGGVEAVGSAVEGVMATAHTIDALTAGKNEDSETEMGRFIKAVYKQAKVDMPHDIAAKCKKSQQR
jgi:hypothetical protein